MESKGAEITYEAYSKVGDSDCFGLGCGGLRTHFLPDRLLPGLPRPNARSRRTTRRAYGLSFKEVEFVSRKGDVNLKGWYLPGEGGKPTLIFVHGIGSVRTGDNAMGLAARLVSHGYNALLFDLRAHGSSGGDKISGGIYEQQDVLGAFDFFGGARDSRPIESVCWDFPWGRLRPCWQHPRSQPSTP